MGSPANVADVSKAMAGVMQKIVPKEPNHMRNPVVCSAQRQMLVHIQVWKNRSTSQEYT